MADTSHSTPYARLVALFSLSAFGLLMTLTGQLQEAATTTAYVMHGANTLELSRISAHHHAAAQKPICDRQVTHTTNGDVVVRHCSPTSTGNITN